MKQAVEAVELDPVHQSPEQVVALALVLHERVLLPVATETDPVSELIHPQQMVLPMMVDHLQEHHFFQVAEQVGGEFLFLFLVPVENELPQIFAQGLATNPPPLLHTLTLLGHR